MVERILLAGDIGGTNTKLAYYSSKEGLHNPLYTVTLENKDFSNFDNLLDSFLESKRMAFDGICLGIAGPVIGNKVQITNLGWIIDGDALKERLDLKGVWLLNDLKALSYAVLNLREDEIEIIREGSREDNAPIAVIAPGTGLGEGYLIWDGNGYSAVSTEGGHTDFGPTTETQRQLLQYLHKKGIRASYERVCSGIGIQNLYSFLRDESYAEEPDWLRDEIAQADDLPPVVFNTALDENKDSSLCEMVIELFVEILGAEAGNMALKTLAQGGVYLGGGIPPRIIPWIKKSTFINAFDNKDPHNELMSTIPISAILNPLANLVGAAYYGLKELD